MSSADLTPAGSNILETLRVSGPHSPLIVADLLTGTGPDAVLVVPGFWRTRADPVMRRISARLHRMGLTVVTLDNRGHGDSGGTFGFNTFESDDTIEVLETTLSMGVLPERPCILGISAGGAIAISTSARRPDLVRGLLLVSPVADFKRVIPRPNLLRPGSQLSLRAALHPPRFWWHERSRRHALDDAQTVDLPACLIHARNDWLVHHSHSERIAERLGVEPAIHILDLERAHAERLLDSYDAPWAIASSFMSRSLGMSLSGT